MQTGVLVPSPVLDASSRDLVAWARDAEDLGFATLAVRGRLVRDSLEPLVALSLVAAATRRVELLVHLPALELTQPRVLARQVSALDRASRGRLVLAVGGLPDLWTFHGRDQQPRRLAVVHLPLAGASQPDAVHEGFAGAEEKGADGVLLTPAGTGRRELERLAALRTPALV